MRARVVKIGFWRTLLAAIRERGSYVLRPEGDEDFEFPVYEDTRP